MWTKPSSSSPSSLFHLTPPKSDESATAPPLLLVHKLDDFQLGFRSLNSLQDDSTTEAAPNSDGSDELESNRYESLTGVVLCMDTSNSDVVDMLNTELQSMSRLSSSPKPESSSSALMMDVVVHKTDPLPMCVCPLTSKCADDVTGGDEEDDVELEEEDGTCPLGQSLLLAKLAAACC